MTVLLLTKDRLSAMRYRGWLRRLGIRQVVQVCRQGEITPRLARNVDCVFFQRECVANLPAFFARFPNCNASFVVIWHNTNNEEMIQAINTGRVSFFILENSGLLPASGLDAVRNAVVNTIAWQRERGARRLT